jgi:hypothetical protein
VRAARRSGLSRYDTGWGPSPEALLRWPIAVGGSLFRGVLGLSSVFAGFRFPPEVISVAVRWYLRYGLSYRDVEELLAERGVTVDHVTIYRWVQRFSPSSSRLRGRARTFLVTGGSWMRRT